MYEQWSLVAGHHPDWLWLITVGLCLGWAVFEAVAGFRHSKLPTPTRGALLGLRLLALLGVLAIATEVTLRIETASESGPRVAVLVDDSATMALSDGEPGRTRSRQQRARAFWEASSETLATWEQRGISVQLHGFSDHLEGLQATESDPLPLQATGRASDLTRALTELAGQRDTRPLAGVVVLSDGLHAPDPASVAPLLSVAEQLDVPVTTVWAGASAIHDISVANVRAGEFAFVENKTEFEVDVVAHGYAGQAARVELRRDGEVLHQTSVTLPSDGVLLPLQFEVAPDRVGQFVFEVVIDPLEGEATQANNRRAFIVKVLRDKVRVLHVAGRPDWDVRALRTLLRRDPNVELLSYYILRGLDDSQRESLTAPLSLIAFPTDELFESQLDSFDLVILQNFDAANHQVGQYLGNIARYVREGGSLVVIGGDLGLATGEYNNSQLAALVPVDLRHATGMVSGPFRPRVSQAGLRHPITGWLREHNLENWDRLPAIEHYNPVVLAPNAEAQAPAVLLRHPDDQTPLLMVAEPAKGRVVVFATGDSWRLGFAPNLPLVEGSRPYDLLWLRLIRWLLRDGSSDRLSLETSRPSYRTGEAVALRAKALTTSYAPSPDVDLAWDIRPLPQERREVPDSDADTQSPAPARQPQKMLPAVAAGTWVTDSLGRAQATVPDLEPGAYVAQAWAPEKPTDDADAQTASAPAPARRVFLVGRDDRELGLVDADPGARLLRQISEKTGGLQLTARADTALPIDLPLATDTRPQRDRQQVHNRREVPLWDGWLALALVLASLSGEWLLRRRAGLR